MARPIWKGSITFGLVTIPVGLYSAIERKGDLSFRLLHAKDASPVDYKRFCAEEAVEVPWSEIVRGYEYERGHFVVMSEGDFDKARVAATQTFEIRDFVPASDIDPLYFDHPYYLGPSGRGSSKAYALLRDAMKQTGRVGVGTIVLRQREHLAALEPVDDALVLTTMRFAHELRKPADLDLPERDAGYAKRELELGVQLVESLAAEWKPVQYRDTYREALLRVIEQKLEGKEVSEAPQPKPARVVSLVKALEQSLEAPRKQAAREERAARPSRGGKTRRARRDRRAA